MIKINTTANLSYKELVDIINANMSTEEKIKLVKDITRYDTAGKLIDMSFVEQAIIVLSKICLKRIKKDRALYNRNRPYFKSLKTILKLKSAD